MATATAAETGKTQPRLKQKYNTEIKKALQEEFGYANVMQIPAWSRSSSTPVSVRRLVTPR